MPCHHDWPPASGQPNEAPYRSLAYVPFTHVPPAALQPRGFSSWTEPAEHETVRIVTPVPPVAYFLKHFVAAGKTVTARQINQVRPKAFPRQRHRPWSIERRLKMTLGRKSSRGQTARFT